MAGELNKHLRINDLETERSPKHGKKKKKKKKKKASHGSRGHQRVFLAGIRASESRPEFWTLSIQPLEVWRAEIKQLGNSERDLLQRAEFYQNLQVAIESQLTAIERPTNSSDEPRSTSASAAIGRALAEPGDCTTTGGAVCTNAFRLKIGVLETGD